jgi:ubiquinone/menaquinone biosynthesis C-methylase UbiE
VRRALAEELPFTTDSFDAALAQLVVHFMRDPVAGLREMARVS